MPAWAVEAASMPAMHKAAAISFFIMYKVFIVVVAGNSSGTILSDHIE
jgi:hypothetical protein